MILYSTQEQKREFLFVQRAHHAAILLAPDYGPEPPCVLSGQLPVLLKKLECTLEFFEAVPIGADLTDVLPRWFYWLLTEELGKYPTSKPVAELYRRQLAGDPPTQEEWRAATNTAAYATHAAARAGQTAAAYATHAAARAGQTAAYAAAAAAAAAADADAAASASATRMREALINIAKETAPSAR
jgi:hypothetical protein